MRTIVIGAGYWGVNYIRELGGNLAAVVEIDKDRADYVSEHYNVKVFPEVPDLDFDAAIIATPPHLHVDIALPLVRQHKYVLIEKPFANSVEEMLRLRAYRNKVMSGLVYLYNPGIEQLKLSVKYVPIHHAFARRTNDGPIREWQDAMWDLTPHDISIFNYIFGDSPFAVTADGTRDWCFIRLDYPTAQALIYASWKGGPKVRTVELVPDDSSDRIVFDDVRSVYEVSPMRAMLDDFLSGSWCDKANFDAGLEVMMILEKASRLL